MIFVQRDLPGRSAVGLIVDDRVGLEPYPVFSIRGIDSQRSRRDVGQGGLLGLESGFGVVDFKSGTERADTAESDFANTKVAGRDLAKVPVDSDSLVRGPARDVRFDRTPGEQRPELRHELTYRSEVFDVGQHDEA